MSHQSGVGYEIIHPYITKLHDLKVAAGEAVPDKRSWVTPPLRTPSYKTKRANLTLTGIPNPTPNGTAGHLLGLRREL